jgi:hypothetical protein
VGGEKDPLKHASPEPLQIVEGRWPGKKAVCLNRDCFQGKPFDVKDKAFTVEIWFRKHGHCEDENNVAAPHIIYAREARVTTLSSRAGPPKRPFPHVRRA